MATTERYTTVIELNSEQAKRQLDDLRRKVESWKQLKDEAIKAKEGKSFVAQINRELKAAEKELKKYDSEVARTIDTLSNLGSASVERIEAAQKHLRRMASEVPRDSALYQQLNDQLNQVTQELENMKATKAFERLQQEATGTTRSAKQLEAELAYIKQIADNASVASVKQLQLAEQTAESIKTSSQKGTDEWNKANESLEKIRGRLTDIDVEEKKVVTTIDRYDEEIRRANKSIEVTNRETALVNSTLSKLSSASVRDIEYSIEILNEQLRETERTGGDVEAITARLKLLNNELRKVQDMQKPDGKKDSIFSRLITGMNKNWGAITQIIGAVTGLTATVRGCVKAFAEMEEELANVRKYTGLADKTIRELNEDFKGMDTRTSREKLNQLAGYAGRLGLQTKEAVKEFVEGADMINVALGDDLGEDAVKNVGKLAMAFGEDERLGLRGAMLATGSAVNELAQNSSAGAGYLIEYTARVAGFGKQLGLTQAQIMGFGAVMDENLLRDEMAATAFGNMLTKMQTDTEKFARIAGMSVENFTKLLNEDANEAVLRLAENLKKQDPSTMMKMLDDMGLDGSRAVAVLATLADKVDDVRQRQEMATKAYKEAVSIGNEFNTMNETAQAKLDKAKKKFHEVSVELGERLQPIVAHTISATSMLIRVTSEIVNFVTKYRTTLITLTAAVVAYTAAVEGQVIISKLQIFWNEKVIASLRALYATMVSNPYLAVATAIATVAAALFDLTRKTEDALASAKTLQEVEREAAADAESETRRLNALVKIAQDKAKSDDERKKAIEEINAISPEYLGNLKLEDFNTQKADVAIKNYTKSILLNAKAKRLAAQIDELERRKEEKRKQLAEGEYSNWYDGFLAVWNSAAETLDRSLNAAQSFVFHGNLKGWNETDATEENGYYTDTARMALGRYKDEVVSLEKQEAALNKVLEETTAEMIKLQTVSTDTNGDGGTIPPYSPLPKQKKDKHTDPDKELQKELRERNEKIRAANEEELAMNMAKYSVGLIDYRTYITEQNEIMLKGIRERMAIYDKDSNEYKKLQLKEQQLLLRGTEEMQRLTLHDLERMHQDLIMQLEHDFNDANSTIYQNEEALNEALFQEEMDYLEQKRDLYNKGSLERMQIEEEIEDLLNRHKLEKEQRYQEQLESLRENYMGQTSEKRMTLELNALDALHKAGLLTEEEYQQARQAIQARYATDPTQQTKVQFSNKASDAFTVAKQKAGDANTTNAWTGDVTNLFAQIRELRANDQLDNAEYLAAMGLAIDDFLKNVQEKYGAVFEGIGNLYNASSAYAKASSDYEVAVVTKNYDKQIEAAGNNQKKVQRLEKKKQEEINKIKTKANDRAMKIEIAQALASTALGAINAYTSTAEIPVVGPTLAPIAAAMAIAAGMLQVATIRKQHQAEAAGYYEGGFTGGRNYRKQAGVVHEGEFVANHEAVQNQNILPFLNFLDQAQRNNTIGSLTMQDVSRSMGAGGSAQVIAPVVNVQTDNEELRDGIAQLNETNDMLRKTIENGIPCVMDTEKAHKALKHHENLLKNKG